VVGIAISASGSNLFQREPRFGGALFCADSTGGMVVAKQISFQTDQYLTLAGDLYVGVLPVTPLRSCSLCSR
jgi:hypothetical protein